MTVSSAARDSAVSGGAGLRAWIAIGILLLLTLSSNIDRMIIGMLVEPIKADLGLDDVQFSLLHGLAFAVFFAVSSVPMGWAADRFSRRWILFLGAAGWSLCTAACGLARSFVHLFIARLGVGMGEAALNPAAYSIVGDLFPRRRLTFALACLASGAAIAAGIGAAGGGYIIAWAEARGGFMGHPPWQVAFWIVGLPGLVFAPLVFFSPERRKPGHAAAAKAAAKAADVSGKAEFLPWLGQNRRYFLCLSLGIGAHTALGTASFWAPAYLARTQGLDMKHIGVMLGLVTGIPTTIGYLGGGWLVDRLVARGVRDVHFRFLAINTLLLTIVGTAAYGFVTYLPLVLVLFAINNMLLPCAGPAIAHLQTTAPDAIRARVLATFLMIMHLTGTVIGPSAAAMISEYYYGGKAHIGMGVATVYAIAGSLGVMFFLATIAPARQALAARQAADLLASGGPKAGWK